MTGFRWLRWMSVVGGMAMLSAPLARAAEKAAASWPDLASVAPDLRVPSVVDGAPGPGRRVRHPISDTEFRGLPYVLWLPEDWVPGKRYPVLIEYAGNGNYRNAFGDVSDGTAEGCRMGYGISGGRGFIWAALPFVAPGAGGPTEALRWWGDVGATQRYAVAAVREIVARFGGEERAVILCGFSRGAIAANFIGLHDDAIAGLWRAFICHSHYDGVLQHWPYVGAADRAAALARLRRLGNRPQFITHEGSVAATAAWLRSSGVAGRWTFAAIPFRNHSPDWLLRDVPARRELRAWLRDVLAER